METGCRLLLFLSVTHKQFNDRGSEKASEERRHLYVTSRLLRECERQTREAEPDGKGEKRATVTFWRPSFFSGQASAVPRSLPAPSICRHTERRSHKRRTDVKSTNMVFTVRGGQWIRHLLSLCRSGTEGPDWQGRGTERQSSIINQ